MKLMIFAIAAIATLTSAYAPLAQSKEEGVGILSTPEEAARHRQALAIASARQVMRGDPAARAAARSALDAAGMIPFGTPPLDTNPPVPRAIDGSAIYRQWLAAALPESRGDRLSATPGPRVSYGAPMGANSYEEVVALLGPNGSTWCSGTLLTRNTVLTAAHCFCGAKPSKAVLGGSVSSPLGTLDLGAHEVMEGVDLSAERASCYASTVGRDLAIVALTAEAGPSVSPRTVRLTGKDELKRVRNGRTLFVVGFGTTETGATGAKARTRVPVINHRCLATGDVGDRSEVGCVLNEEIVSMLQDRTPTRPVAGACASDSGGPAYLNVDGRRYQVGVISRGLETADSPPNCGDLGIYTRLNTKKRQFIASACSKVGGTGCP